MQFENMIYTFDYEKHFGSQEKIVELLNYYGEQGWGLIQIVGNDYYFLRALPKD